MASDKEHTGATGEAPDDGLHAGLTLIRAGELVSSGYVERQDIDAFLTPDAYRTQTFGRMILVYYVIECWLRRWRTELGAR
jgi:asparagine synthase (glutamine-hydrolysing)